MKNKQTKLSLAEVKELLKHCVKNNHKYRFTEESMTKIVQTHNQIQDFQNIIQS